jgi:hypothetical protein
MATLQQEAQTKGAASNASIAKVAHKLEVLVIPVSDVDRAEYMVREQSGEELPK